MSGALKWSPFDSSRWPSSTDVTGRTPPLFMDSFVRPVEAPADPAPVRVEEYVDHKTLVVRAEMPGADPDRDIAVTMAAGVLHIRAEGREPHTRTGGEGFPSGRYLPFSRTVPLPEGVTDQDIKVSYRDGVLEVRTPLPAAPSTDATEKRLTISRE